MPPEKSTHPALFYSLRIIAIVFAAEFLIMLFFMEVAPVRDELLKSFLDGALLVVLLSPAFYWFVYAPMIREIKKRVELQNELEDAHLRLRERAVGLERRLGEKMAELQNAHAQYTAMVEMSNDMIVAADSKRRIVFWNRLAEDEFGYSKEEAVGKDTSLIIPDKHKEAHATGFDNFIKRPAGLARGRIYRAEGLKKDGTLIDVEISLSSYESNRALFVVAIIRNVTERVRSEEMIRKQLKQLTALRQIDLAITSSLDLQITLAILLDQIAELFRDGAVDILLFNPVSNALEYIAGRGFTKNSIRRSRLKMGEGYAGRAALEQRTIHIPDLTDESVAFVRSELIAEGYRSYTCVPLIAKKEIKGVIELFMSVKTGENPEYLPFFEALALQAAIAIDNASLFNRLYRMNMDLKLAYEGAIEGWASALDLRDKETEGHSRRVMDMTVEIARSMGLDETQLVHIRRGALLHDIGKMGIADSILLKPGPLTDEEWRIMKKHPVYAQQLLSPIAYLRPAIDIPYCHHERWDGTGYPRGLKGDEIPLCARIFAVVDVWDALTSPRPYRPAWPIKKVCGHMKSLSGTHLDPGVLEIFLNKVMPATSAG